MANASWNPQRTRSGRRSLSQLDTGGPGADKWEKNQGVAPFYYYPWPVELVLLDRTNKPIEQAPVRWDLRKWLPGRFSEEAVWKPAIRPREYRLAIGIIDPWTKQPTMALANDLARQNGWTVLSKVSVRAK